MTQDKPAEWAMKAAVAAFDQPLPTDSIMLSVARAIEAADKAATERERRDLYDASKPMADDGDFTMTAAEQVLAWLLIEVVRVPDDVPYSPDQAQTIIAAAIRKGGDND